jgi:hypothetical protein
MQDLTPVVDDDEKAVQNTKRERWDGEEIHRRNGLAMVPEEGQPSLHRIWTSRGSPDQMDYFQFADDVPGILQAEGTSQDRVVLHGLAIQKFDQFRDDLILRFFNEPVAGIANDHTFDIRRNKPALLNEKVA